MGEYIDQKDISEKELQTTKAILTRATQAETFLIVEKESHPLNGWSYVAVETDINAEGMALLLNRFAKNTAVNDRIAFGKNSQGVGFINVFGKTPEDLKSTAEMLNTKMSTVGRSSSTPALAQAVPAPTSAPTSALAAPVVTPAAAAFPQATKGSPDYRKLIPKAAVIAEKAPIKKIEPKEPQPKPAKPKKERESFTAALVDPKEQEIMVGKIAAEALKHPVKTFENRVFVNFRLGPSFNIKEARAALTAVLTKYRREDRLAFNCGGRGDIYFGSPDAHTMEVVLTECMQAHDLGQGKK